MNSVPKYMHVLFFAALLTALAVAAVLAVSRDMILAGEAQLTSRQIRFLTFNCVLLLVLWTSRVYWERTRAMLHEFFAASTHPANLAFFRIAIFLALIIHHDTGSVVWYSSLPAEFQFAPFGLGGVLDALPIEPDLARIASALFLIFCGTALVGIFTRTSSLLAVVLGLYVLGIPQFYGKINHYHHLLWFAGILAASRSGDALSLDALWRNWRANRRLSSAPEPSRVYALPLRFVWLLIGIIYFFPGLWKVVNVGWEWAWSENLKWHLYLKWMEFDGWMPAFRIDRHPLLYRLGGIGTILFELSFIFLILFRRTRMVAAAAGLVFHNLTALTMRISFWTLQIAYVSFVDWYGAYSRLKNWLRQPPKNSAQEIQRTAVSARCRGVVLVGTVLVVLNALSGYLGINSWPFSNYPTFAYRAPPHTALLTVRVTGANGRAHEFSAVQQLRLTPASPERLRRLQSRILAAEGARQEQMLSSYARVLFTGTGARSDSINRLTFYRDVYFTDPNKGTLPRTSRELLLELP